MELNVPAIYGIGESLLYFVDRPPYDIDFVDGAGIVFGADGGRDV